MQGVLLILAVIALVVGMILGQLSISRYTSPEGPHRPGMSVRYWKPFWRMRSSFVSEKGFRIYVVSSALLVAGGILVAVALLAID